MTLLALALALLIEQIRPVRRPQPCPAWLAKGSRWLTQGPLQGCRPRLRAWCVLGLAGLLLAGATLLLAQLGSLVWWGANVAALYLAMGHREEARHFREIHAALRQDDPARAASWLQRWTGHLPSPADESQIVAAAMEAALRSSFRNVFVVVFWFVLLPGPFGPLCYAGLRQWAQGSGEAALVSQIRIVLRAMEALPARLTALAFAVAGDFEGALYGWRSLGDPHRNADRIVLAAGAGALGVVLPGAGGEGIDPAMALPRREHLQASLNLLWRALGLMLLGVALCELIA